MVLATSVVTYTRVRIIAAELCSDKWEFHCRKKNQKSEASRSTDSCCRANPTVTDSFCWAKTAVQKIFHKRNVVHQPIIGKPSDFFFLSNQKKKFQSLFDSQLKCISNDYFSKKNFRIWTKMITNWVLKSVISKSFCLRRWILGRLNV